MEFLRPLEVTVLSAQGLKDVNLFSKMDVYTNVSIGDEPTTRKRTPVDKDGGKNPRWNHRISFTVDENVIRHQPNLCLWFRIKSQRPLGDRDIGHVAVPLKELLDGNPADGERTVEYQVRTPDGKAKGTLKLAYRFGDRYGTPAVAAAGSSAVASPKVKDNEPVTAYPAQGAGASTAYPAMPATGYGPPKTGYATPYAPVGAGYGHPPPQQAYASGYPPPQQAYASGYPQATGYGYPPQQQQQQHGYGYPPAMMQQQAPKKKKNSKLGLGLGAGLLGGLLVGDMIGDVGEMAAYDSGYGDGFGDGGFDGGFDF